MKNLSFYPSTQSKIRIKSILWNPGPRKIQSTPEYSPLKINMDMFGFHATWVWKFTKSVWIIVRLSPGPGPEINPTIGPQNSEMLEWYSYNGLTCLVDIFLYIYFYHQLIIGVTRFVCNHQIHAVCFLCEQKSSAEYFFGDIFEVIINVLIIHVEPPFLNPAAKSPNL